MFRKDTLEFLAGAGLGAAAGALLALLLKPGGGDDSGDGRGEGRRSERGRRRLLGIPVRSGLDAPSSPGRDLLGTFRSETSRLLRGAGREAATSLARAVRKAAGERDRDRS